MVKVLELAGWHHRAERPVLEPGFQSIIGTKDSPCQGGQCNDQGNGGQGRREGDTQNRNHCGPCPMGKHKNAKAGCCNEVPSSGVRIIGLQPVRTFPEGQYYFQGCAKDTCELGD